MGTHITLPLPHPQKRGLLVWVDAAIIAANPNILPPKGTRYGDFKRGIITKDYNYRFSDYIYTRQGENDREGNAGLYFSPPLSEEESSTPFETETRQGNHYWPPILKSVGIIKARTIAGVNRQGRPIYKPRYFSRVVYIPSVQEGSLITTRKYLYSMEPDIPQSEVPMPTSVQWDLPGASGSFPECLHPLIVIPAGRSETLEVNIGDPSSGGVILRGQRFEATNFTDWQEYDKSDGYEFTNGAYVRTVVTVTPPPEPPPNVR